MKKIKIERCGSGWGGIYHKYVCTPEKEFIYVSSIPELSASKKVKEYRIRYNFFLKYLFDNLPTCSYKNTGCGVMDNQDDIVYRVNDDDTEEMIYRTEGLVLFPTDHEITKMLSLLIYILSLIDSDTIRISQDYEIYVIDDRLVSHYAWFEPKRAILARYCDSSSYCAVTNGPHCDNCILRGMSSCRFLDHERSDSYIDEGTIQKCYDTLMK